MIAAVNPGVLATFTLLWVVVVPTPGANSLMVTHVALTRPRGHVALAIAGNMVGVLVLALAALVGLAYLLQQFPWLRVSLNLLGGLYLVYFGARLLVRRKADLDVEDAKGAAIVDGRDTFLLGFLTAVSNAQAIIFIASVFTTAGILDASFSTGLLCILIAILCNACYLSFLGWLFLSRPARALYRRFRRALELGIGATFVLLGMRVAARELIAILAF